jgi:hypothetical protein
MKMQKKNIEYTTCTDIEKMLAQGIKSAPVLQVNDELLQFADAVKWVNNK